MAIQQSASWESEQLFLDGDSYFDALRNAVERSKTSIDIESYILENDPLSESVITCLIAAQNRQVHVRILIDGLGGGSWALENEPRLKNIGIELRVYHPLPWLMFPSLLRNVLAVQNFLRFALRMNRRNHRKTCVVDGKCMFLGSMNLSVFHSKRLHGESAWRDTGVCVLGPGVVAVQNAFELTWKKSWRIGLSIRAPSLPWRKQSLLTSHPLVRLNNTMVLRWKMYNQLLKRIRTAKNTVWLTNAYFVPHGTLLRALEQAAKNGADVRLLLPQKSDVVFLPWVSAAFFQALVKNGVRVFEYLPGMIHAKTMVIDSWCAVGSSNFNSRSLRHDLEIDVVLTSADSRKSLVCAFENDLSTSEEVTVTSFSRRPVWQRILGRLALMVKYWL